VFKNELSLNQLDHLKLSNELFVYHHEVVPMVAINNNNNNNNNKVLAIKQPVVSQVEQLLVVLLNKLLLVLLNRLLLVLLIINNQLVAVSPVDMVPLLLLLFQQPLHLPQITVHSVVQVVYPSQQVPQPVPYLLPLMLAVLRCYHQLVVNLHSVFMFNSASSSNCQLSFRFVSS